MNQKRRNLFLYAGVLLLVAIIIFICTNGIVNKNVDTVSREQMAKMIVMAQYGEEELLDITPEPFFDVAKEEKSLIYCYQAVKDGYMQLIHEAFSPGVAFSIEDAYLLMKKAKIEKKEITFSVKKGALPEKEVFQLYDIFLHSKKNPNGIKEASFYLGEKRASFYDTSLGALDASGVDKSSLEPGVVKGYVTSNQVIAIRGKDSKSKVTFSNAWVVAAGNQVAKIFANGVEWNIPYDSQGMLTKLVADVTVTKNQVVSLVPKEDKISARVLAVGDKMLEVEGYGTLLEKETCPIYKLYGSLAMEETPQVLMNFPTVDIILENGDIAAVLLNQEADNQTIKVALNTTGYKGIFHKKFTCSCSTDMELSYSDTKEDSVIIPKGQKISFKKKSEEFNKGRIILTPVSTDGVITITSFKRSYGNPEYHGSIEVTKTAEGITVINNVPIEEYLYSVVPSEMPVSYGAEALKVQAICARSYAFCQLDNGEYSKYGAQVEDSTKCQVYNNSKENEASIQAVKETTGEVLDCNNEVVLAYFFSTSCGYTSDSTDVWFQNANAKAECPDYLKGKLQGKGEDILDLSEEGAFRKFISEDAYDTYEKDMPWYRWQVTESAEHIQMVLENKIAALGDNVYVKQEDGSFMKGTTSLGNILGIAVTKRGTSGIAKEIEITGETAVIRITTEYAIRLALAPLYDAITQNDGNAVNFTMLPSGYFYIDPVEDETGIQFVIHGGGYGHGVGMSQNGVKVMSEQGSTAKEMIHHFFTNTTIKNIY